MSEHGAFAATSFDFFGGNLHEAFATGHHDDILDIW